MRTIYILIKCKLGKTYEVASKLVEAEDNVPLVHSISGQYDLIARFDLRSGDDIGRFVTERVQKIPEIVDTNTIICFNVFSKDSGIRDDQ
ncbi:MAG: Lrp/AsnC ligand binding domain-containing protein [Alphaproteobacteria bacterium]